MKEAELREAMSVVNTLTSQLHPGDRLVITMKDTLTGELSPLVLEKHHSFVKIELTQRSNISVNASET